MLITTACRIALTRSAEPSITNISLERVNADLRISAVEPISKYTWTRVRQVTVVWKPRTIWKRIGRDNFFFKLKWQFSDGILSMTAGCTRMGLSHLPGYPKMLAELSGTLQLYPL